MERKTMNAELVVMLTHNDFTVPNAAEVFGECRNSEARFWGMKEKGLPVETMRRLYAEMREAGVTTVLEVVGYTEEEAVKGARLAAECGVDIMMGTMFSPRALEECHAAGIRYMPFVGRIEGRPSVLMGGMDEIAAEAREAVATGADGIDLLGYRYVDNAVALNRLVSEAVDGRLCIAGSVDSYQRLDEVKASGAALFTIGGAFFENKFDGTICEQINKVCRYMRNA